MNALSKEYVDWMKYRTMIVVYQRLLEAGIDPMSIRFILSSKTT